MKPRNFKEAVANRLPIEQPEESEPRPKRVWPVTQPPKDWYTVAPPKRVWLMRDIRTGRGTLPLGKAGQFIAQGGAGKTTALAALMVAVATGTPWLKTFECRQGKVLALLGEEDNEELRRKMYHASRGAGVVPEDGSIHLFPLAGEMCAFLENDLAGPREGEFLGHLRAYLHEHGPFALTIIDPLSRFAGVEAERDNAEGTRFVQKCESLIPASGGGCTLTAHHSNKQSRGRGTKPDVTSGRGSSSLYDGVRWEIQLGVEDVPIEGDAEAQHLRELVTLVNTKSNYSLKFAELKLRRDLDREGALVPLDAVDEQLVDACTDMESRKERKEEEKRAKKANRDAEAKRIRDEERERSEAQKRERKRQRAVDDDALLADIHARYPLASRTELRSLFEKMRGCSGRDSVAVMQRNPQYHSTKKVPQSTI